MQKKHALISPLPEIIGLLSLASLLSCAVALGDLLLDSSAEGHQEEVER